MQHSVFKGEMSVKMDFSVIFMELNVVRMELKASHLELNVVHLELKAARMELNVARLELKAARLELNVIRMELKAACLELNVVRLELNVIRMERALRHWARLAGERFCKSMPTFGGVRGFMVAMSDAHKVLPGGLLKATSRSV